MLFVLPTTSTIHPTSYFAPESYEFYPSHSYHPYFSYEPAQFTIPSYPGPSDLEFFHHPSAEELEEREYQRALGVIANRRRRQAEKEAELRQQQLAESAHQQYIYTFAQAVERQRQEQLLAARREELVRAQQARARLVATERQRALNSLLRELKGPQPITRQPHVTKRKPLADALKQRLASEPEAEITETIEKILSSLESPPVESRPKESTEDTSDPLENLLSSIFYGLVGNNQHQPTPSPVHAEPTVTDKGKGKTRAVDLEGPQKPAEKPEPVEDAFADMLRHVMELSKSAPTSRSPDQAGPSGSQHMTPTSPSPPVTDQEVTQVDSAIALSSVERIQNALAKLQADFVLPTELEHYTSPADDRDETASVTSVSSSDLTKLIPYTRANKLVYKYENELNGLLEELDKIESHGDAEVREKRREVVKAVENALENVERLVGEVVEKRLSPVVPTTPVADEPLKGFDVDSVAEETAPAQEQIESLDVVESVPAPEPSPRVCTEETIINPPEVPLPTEEIVPEPDTVVISGPTSELPVEPSVESNIEAPTPTPTPALADSEPEAIREPEEPQVQVESVEVAEALPENISPPSPVQNAQQIDGDIDHVVVSLDGDWSEVEH